LIAGVALLVVVVGMDKPATDLTSKSDADFEASHPLRPLVLAGAMTLMAYAGGVGVVGFVASGQVSTARQWAWLGTEIVFLITWLGLVVTMWIRQPNAREGVRIWGRASAYIAITSQVMVCWAIWSFFPTCTSESRLLLSGMFLSCSPAQLIAAPENVLANRIGIVISLGSLALWLALEGSAISLQMASFVSLISIMLFVLCNYVPSTVAQTVEARLAAELAKRQLEAALVTVAEERDAKTRFIASASHDLGQPLQAASLFFDQALRAPDAAQRNRAADGVRKAFASADQLLSHMLNHLRLEADAVAPHFSNLLIGPIIARIAAQFGPAASQAGITIKTMPSRKRLHIDRVLFERALGNLIHNAILHSGATRLLIGVRKAGRDRVRVWVIDNGVGVARVDGVRIFDDYYQGSDSRAALKSGFGLGLSSVRRIAVLLEGQAGLDPRWLGGAAFYLDFPMISPAKEAVR
jgi:signal transduction histidine kinase